MGKVKVVLICFLLLALTSFCFFACTGKDPVPQEAPVSIDPITIAATEEGISFTHSDIKYFFYNLDGGDREETPTGGIVDYSEVPGKHTIKVFSLDAEGNEVAVSQYDYTTIALSLSDLSVSGKTVSWVANAKTVYVKDSDDFVETTETDYTTEKESGTIRVKAEGGFVASSATYYAGSAITKSAKIVSTALKTLGTPVLKVQMEPIDPAEVQRLSLPSWSVDSKLVVWNDVLHASKYAVSYDGDDFVVATRASLSDEVGRHSIRVKALGDGETYDDGVPALYEYETIRAATPIVNKLDFNYSAISFDAPNCYYSVDDFEYQKVEELLSEENSNQTQRYAFRAGATATYRFRAWGVDVERNKNYVVSDPVAVSFLAPATTETVVEDASADAIDVRWLAEKQDAAGWTSIRDRIGYGTDYEENRALKMIATKDGGSYRFSTSLALTRAHDYLSFRYFGDGVSSVRLMLSREEGFSIECDLGVLPEYWQEVTLRLNSSIWSISGTSLTVLDAWAGRASIDSDALPLELKDTVSVLEVFPLFDRISVLIRCEDEQGEDSFHYIGNLAFGYDVDRATAFVQPIFALASSFVAQETIGSVTNELLFYLSEDSSCRVYSTALEQNFILIGTYVVNEDSATIFVEGASYAFLLSLTHNGQGAVVAEAEGVQSEHFLSCAPLIATADITEDLESGVSGSEYDGSDWNAYIVYPTGEAMPLVSPHIHYAELDGSTVLRLSVGKDLTDRFVFRETKGKYGLANTVTIRLGNCMDEAAPLAVKLIATDKDGTNYYLKGSEGAFWTLDLTDGLADFASTLPKAITFDSFTIEVKNATENSLAYLYVDDLHITYKADPSVFSGYPKPTIEAGASLFTFGYSEEDVAFEYSLNDGEWFESTNCPIPSVSGYYTLRVRALIGVDRVPSQIAAYAFSVEEVYISAISVAIEEDGQVATWQTNGNLSIRVDRKTESGVEIGEYTPSSKNSYFTDKNVILNVRSEGYFDSENKKYYVGTQEISKNILVDVVLGAPLLQAGQQGLYWDAVEDANAYAVSVNGGDYVTREDRTYPFAINEGHYVIRVKSVYLNDQGEESAYGTYTEYSYDVKLVSLAPLVKEKATVSWSAVAYKAFLQVDVAEYEEKPLVGSFKATVVGANQITVKAVAGYDAENKIYYYAAKDLTQTVTVTVQTLSAPTILVKSDTSGLYWAFVKRNEESGEITQITTIEDFASINPEVTYHISVNGGEWIAATDFPFPTIDGEYVVKVKTIGNGENLRDSEESAPYAFTVRSVALSELPVYLKKEVKEQGGSEITFEHTALHTYQKIGTNGAEKEIEGNTFSTDKTISYSIRVVGGWDDECRTYYAGSAIVRTWDVVVPIKLLPLVLTHSKDGLAWSVEPSQRSVVTGFDLWINDEYLGNTTATARSFSECGVYKVSLKAVNTDYPEQYLDSEPVEITYSVVEVALSQPRMDGAIVRWSYEGLNLYLKLAPIGEQASYDLAHPYNDTAYANENGADVTVSLLVKGGYDSVNVVYYKGNDIEKQLDIQYSELLAPKLKVNAAGDGLEWEEVSQAGGYCYKTIAVDLTEEEIEAASLSEEGWTDTVGRYYAFEGDDDLHAVLIKSKRPENSTITDSVPSVWRYRSSPISLSGFEVNEGVATWEKNGFTEIQTYLSIGNPVGFVPYAPITVCTLAPEATLYADLRCKAGYDAATNVYYHGATITLEKNLIIVPIYLEMPTVRAETTWIALSKPANANAYKISVNGGDYEVFEDNWLDYANAVGSYTVKIRSYHKTQPEQYPESADVVVTYDVRTVMLSDITEVNVSTQGGDAHFTADGVLSIGTNGVADQPLLLDYHGESYTCDYHLTATATVYVKAACGVRVLGEQSAVKYIGDQDIEKSHKVIIPIKLAKPSLNETSSGLSIQSVPNANNYLVSIDGGAWKAQTEQTVSYQSTIGDHSISVKAHSTREDGQYPDSDEATVQYKTVALSLSDITLSGATFSWSANAHTVKRSTDDGKSWTVTSSSEYTATSSGTTKLKVAAYAGYVAATHTYYYGSTVTKEKSVTITKLSAPTLSVSGKNLTWTAVSGAKQYAVKVGSGSYNYQTDRSYALSTQAGSYKIVVKAVNKDDATVLDSDERTLEYTTKVVTLSNISVSGSTATWSVTAYKTYLKVGSGNYQETTATSYVPSSEGTFAIKVKAEGGWDNSNKVFYYASAAIEKSASVTLAKLATPTLTTNAKGVIWSSVSNASTYSVKVDGGNYKNQSDKSVAFSTSTGTHKVYVKAIAAANSGYQDSEAASFTYETKQTSFSFLSSSATRVTWQYSGLKAQYSTNNGSSYTDTTLTGYTASATGSVSFRAVGGWDAAGCVFYNGTTTAQSKSFTLPGLSIANNFEKGVGGWTKQEYKTNAWATNNNIGITPVIDAYGAGTAIKVKTWLNGMSYRIGYQFGDFPTVYKSLSFDVKLADPSEAKTSFTFQDSASGTYVVYSLENLGLTHGVWYHVTIGFEDPNLVINSGNKNYTQAELYSFLKEKKYYEKMKELDTLFITIKGTTSNGAVAQTYFDNFQFSSNACTTATKTRINTTELNFTDGTANADYTNSKWKQYEYKNNGYSSTSGKLKIEAAEGDKVLSLYAGYNTYKITYNEGGSSLGTFNHFAIDVGCESSATVKYRIEIVTESGTIYAVGGAETMATIASPGGNAALTTVTFNFAATKVKSITIYASAGNANGHLYMDNMILTNLS